MLFKGFQLGDDFVDDIYLFTVDNKELSVKGATFSVTELDVQSVESALKVLLIMEQFQEQFPEYNLIFSGVQLGEGFGDDMYLFTIYDKESSAHGATFIVTELDLQSVKDAFVKKMKLFGEDIEEVA